MLDIIKAIILGIVEGITEFLPISSTGHLILVNEFIKMSQSTQFTDMFNVVIQLGAIMAVVVLYFHKLNPLSPKKPTLSNTKLGFCGSRLSLPSCHPSSLAFCSMIGWTRI